MAFCSSAWSDLQRGNCVSFEMSKENSGLKFPLRFALAAGLTILAAVLSFPGLLGISSRVAIQPDAGEGHLLRAKAGEDLPRIRGRALIPPESPVLFENNAVLAFPNSSEKHIRNGGFGRYSIKGREILFSTSDGNAPGDRNYQVVWPRWSLAEGVLIPIWIAAGIAWIFVFGKTTPLASRGLLIFKISAAVLFLSLCVLSPKLSAWWFFDGLAIPLLWAALVGAWADSARSGRIIACAIALVPLGASVIVHLFEAQSHGSFIVGGIVPRSDAWVHFRQAIDIATAGGTEVFFNGRFIYPAYFGALLALSGANLAFAILASTALVLIALGIASSHVARAFGWVPASMLCLIVWLYYRNDGCGAVMSENFGLLAGLLALPFLIAGFRGNRALLFSWGVMILGVGFSARPGALFLMPALGFACGVIALRRGGGLRGFIFSTVLAGVFGIAGLASNSILTATLARGGQGVAFGNFAYSLHGLLHGTDWEESYTKYQGDTKRIMQINMDRLREDPSSLVRGIGRAYGDTFGRRFLFRFGAESRVAAIGMIGFCVAGIAGWFLRDWKKDAPWLTAAFLGILLSVPFAPPWDASVRPYAATIPLQSLLAGIGWCMLIGCVAELLNKRRESDPRIGDASLSLALPGVFAAGILFLAFAGPFLFRATLPSSAHGEAVFLSGASVVVGGDSRQVSGSTFRRGLSELVASYPDSARQFENVPDGFKFGILSPSLEVAVLPWPKE